MPITINSARAIQPGTLRVLAAVMTLTQTGSVTLRKIADKLGICHNAVEASIKRLERRGLITRERGCCNTIRPCVKFIPYNQEHRKEAVA